MGFMVFLTFVHYYINLQNENKILSRPIQLTITVDGVFVQNVFCLVIIQYGLAHTCTSK